MSELVPNPVKPGEVCYVCHGPVRITTYDWTDGPDGMHYETLYCRNCGEPTFACSCFRVV